ncbi:MAG: PQQ-dependent sugar dehydrogenase [Saprospiraceae bacterium]|nr:PQQ-dependent sugar dehydrogenase [Saprospiraceae bacterium]
MCQTNGNKGTSASGDGKFAGSAEKFKTICSSCHGANVDVFVDRQWKHGSHRDSLIKSITNGFPEKEMPAFGQVFKKEEIAEMAEYILNSIEDAKRYKFDGKPKSNVFVQSSMTVKLDTVVSGLKNPWGIAFLPEGELLVTDRNGDFYRVDKNRQKTLIEGAPKVLAEGQGGLLDVELHPKFAENGFIYLSYSKFRDSAGGKWSTTAVMRAKLSGNKLTEQKDIFVAQPYQKTRHHYGSRLEFDKNGYLFVTVGDRGQHDALLPQKLNNDMGKVHRMHDDGRIPADNPFVKNDTARKTIFSYGHRNPQGMAMNPTTGAFWTNEHGPRGGDEINITQAGKNFGWPVISYGINYDGTILTPYTKKDGMEQPLHYWIPSIGVCGATFVTGDRYKAWKGDFLVGSLRFEYLNRCKIEGTKVVKEEILLKNIGRLRCVEMGRDGYIYVSVEQPGYVFRLLPVE